MQFKSITAIIVLLLVVVSLSIAGCTYEQNQYPSVYTVGESSAAPATTSGLEVTAKQVTLSQQEQSAAKKAGFKIVSIDCTVKNVGTETQTTAYNVWTLRDMQGGVYDPVLGVDVTGDYWSAVTRGNWWNPGSDLEPGDILHGVVVFEVPANVQQFKSITYHGDYAKVVVAL